LKINSRTEITLSGYVGTVPEKKETPNGALVSFRMSVRPKPLVTEWYSVSAWRGLGDLVMANYKKGSAIKVTGHIRQYKLLKTDTRPEREVWDVVAHRVGIFIDEDEVQWFRPEGGAKLTPDSSDLAA